MEFKIEDRNGYASFACSEGTQLLDAQYKLEDLKIPVTLGEDSDGMKDDIVTRIIRICHEEGRFVAPSFQAIGNQIQCDLQKVASETSANRAIDEATARDKLIEYIRIGLSRFMRRDSIFDAPIVNDQAKNSKTSSSPESVLVTMFRNQPDNLYGSLFKLFIEMLLTGNLTLIEKGPDKFCEPTEQLIESILRTQGGAHRSAKHEGV